MFTYTIKNKKLYKIVKQVSLIIQQPIIRFNCLKKITYLYINKYTWEY